MSAALERLEQAADAFRVGREAAGNEAFVAFVDALSEEFARPERAAAANAIAPILPEIVAAQRRGDFVTVADLLLFEVAPVLAG